MSGGDDGNVNSNGGAGTNSESNRVSETIQAFLSEPSGSLNQLFSAPCFKKSILWGTSLGGMLAAHRFHASRSVVKTLDASVLGFLVGSGASWINCRTTRKAEKDKLDEAMKKLNELQRRSKVAASNQVNHQPRGKKDEQ